MSTLVVEQLISSRRLFLGWLVSVIVTIACVVAIAIIAKAVVAATAAPSVVIIAGVVVVFPVHLEIFNLFLLVVILVVVAATVVGLFASSLHVLLISGSC